MNTLLAFFVAFLSFAAEQASDGGISSPYSADIPSDTWFFSEEIGGATNICTPCSSSECCPVSIVCDENMAYFVVRTGEPLGEQNDILFVALTTQLPVPGGQLQLVSTMGQVVGSGFVVVLPRSEAWEFLLEPVVYLWAGEDFQMSLINQGSARALQRTRCLD